MLSGVIAQVWRNTGSGFANINAGLPGAFGRATAWGDYDGDGRLDILLAAVNSSAIWSVQVWRNHVPLTNTPPTTPTGLTVTISANVGTFTWNGSVDARSPAANLTYNLRVGTTPGGSQIVTAMSSDSGWRRLPQPGNSLYRLTRTIAGLPLATPMYWSVQAVDPGFVGSAFAPEQTFTINTVFTPTNGIPVTGDADGNGIVSQSELDGVLSNYFPYSPWLRMTNVAGLGGTNVTFALSNSTAGAFSVEYSTNLTNWYFLGPATPLYEFDDTSAPAVPRRYYRLRWP
jgi:hypothetical protein